MSKPAPVLFKVICIAVPSPRQQEQIATTFETINGLPNLNEIFEVKEVLRGYNDGCEYYFIDKLPVIKKRDRVAAPWGDGWFRKLSS